MTGKLSAAAMFLGIFLVFILGFHARNACNPTEAGMCGLWELILMFVIAFPLILIGSIGTITRGLSKQQSSVLPNSPEIRRSEVGVVSRGTALSGFAGFVLIFLLLFIELILIDNNFIKPVIMILTVYFIIRQYRTGRF